MKKSDSLLPPSLDPAIDWNSESDIIVSSYGSMTMKGLLSFLCISVGGAIGWWLGSFVGLMTAIFASIVGSGAGLYVALRFHREYFE